MSYHHRAAFALLLLSPILVGCAPAKYASLGPIPAPTATNAPLDPRFQSAEAILAGIDALEDSAAVGPDDRVLLGLIVRRCGRETVRFVDVSVPAPMARIATSSFTMGESDNPPRYTSALVRGHVRLLDQDGRVLREGEGDFAVGFLETGLYRLGELLAIYTTRPHTPEGGLDVTPEHLEEIERGFCAFLSFTTVVNNRSQSIFRSLAMDFIGARGMFALIASFGSFVVSARETAVAGVTRIPGINRDLPAYAIPIVVAFGKTPVMHCILTVVEPVSPLTLTAGIVRIDISRPSNPDDTITVQLLAARRGVE